MVFHCFDEQSYDNVGCEDILLILLRHINAYLVFSFRDVFLLMLE